MTPPDTLQADLVAMNEALILGSVHQHELTETAERLNARLEEEIAAKDAMSRELEATAKALSEIARELAEKARLIDLSNDAIVVRDLDGKIRLWNKGAEKLFGWTFDEVKGQDLDSFLQTEFPRPKEEILVQLDLEGRFNDEVTQIARDGRRVRSLCGWVLDRGTESIFTSYTDVTEHRKAEEALRASEEHLGLMANAMPQLAWTARPDGHISWYNERWYEYTGLSPEEMEGWGWEKVQDPLILPLVLERWNQSIVSGQPFEMTFPLRGADGNYRPFLTRVIPLKSASGEVLEWFGTNTDVTELTRAQKALQENDMRLRLAIQSTGVGIWQWNYMTGEVRWDAQMFEIYGIPASADGLVNLSTWRECLLPEDLHREDELTEDLIRWPGHGSSEFRIKHAADGNHRHIRVVYSVRANDVGAAEWLVGTNLDITDRKRGEEALRCRAEELATANLSKDEFLAMLAHELRNPLASLRVAAEILQNPGAPAEACQHAKSILVRQIGNMNQMIDDLLDVSRITEGKIDLRKEVVSLEAIISAVVSAADPALEARGQEFTVSLPDEPVFLHADATRLEQIFGNLLNNASKFSASGCQISLAAERGPGGVIVRVRDNGVGIEPELLPHVFDLFLQATRASDRAHGGLGIGLTVVKRLVALHGGSVEARSEGLGHGSEFVVRLPILAGPADPPPTPAAQGDERSFRMLVVDDNVDAAEAMALLQSMRGHQTRSVHTGAAALELAAEFLPEVVLLDIGLPGMDGYEVARKLRSMPELDGAFLIAMTGYGSEEDRAQAMAAGFDKHLVKPADLELLRGWLRER